MAQQEDMLKEAQDYVNALASQRDFHQNECTKFMAAALKAKRDRCFVHITRPRNCRREI